MFRGFMQRKYVFLTMILSVLISAGTSTLITSKVAQDTTTANQISAELGRLKQEVVNEREYRESLEQRVLARLAAQSNGAQATVQPAPTQLIGSASETDAELSREEQIRAFRERAVARTQPEFRKQILLDNGFADDEATWILQIEAEVQLESLNQQYQVRRAQLELEQANGTRAKSNFEQLKEKLGDDYYERYLEANGFPTSVGVNSVLDGSPGANAGLQAGDKILSYDGNRVFNIRELNGLTISGEENQSVLLEVERNGNPVQITLPRGPIGITGGRGRF